MRTILATILMLILPGCHFRAPVISDEEYLLFKESNPGMVQACLKAVRYGGWSEWRPNDPSCYELRPSQQWSGLWDNGWEWSRFCPAPASTCSWMNESGTWLVFANSVDLQDLRDGVHRITFVGRRTKKPGYFGHLGGYEHLMVVDRLISIHPAEEKK